MKVILLVDDEPLLLSALEFDFKRRGFKVLTASDGLEALDKLQAERVDLVISDMNMPQMDGKNLLIKTKKLFPHIPFILFITGNMILEKDEALRLGCDEVFSKPFDRATLFKTVESLVGQS